MEMSDILEKKMTTSVSIKVKHQMWLERKRASDLNFTLTGYIGKKIDEDMIKEGGNNGATRSI